MSAAPVPSWRPNTECSEKDCSSDAAYDRTDGRCYRHGKIADGLMAKLQSNPGRPPTGTRVRTKGRAHHNKF